MLIGRPQKYVAILRALDPDELYSPAMIARFAKEHQLLAGYRQKDKSEKLIMQRIRVALIRMTSLKRNSFPSEGDGLVVIPGQAPRPGWYGWRWQSVIKD